MPLSAKGDAMGKEKVNEELLTQWIHLRRKGRSYRSIAMTFGVDPRTIKSWVQRAGEEKEKQHWEAVSRQVDAKYLDEHYRMIVQVAVAVLDAVHTEPVSVHRELDTRALLSNCIQSAVQKSAELVTGRGLDMADAPDELSLHIRTKNHVAQRLSRKLLDALMEHEPQLKTAIEAWETDWSRFQQARLRLAEAAKNLFKLGEVSDKAAEGLKLAVVQEALENKLFGQEPCSSQVEDHDDGQASLIRYDRRTSKRIYEGPKQEIEAACNAYHGVLSQVSHKARMRLVENVYHCLRERVREVEDLVDRLVLMGRPQGQCPLCLNHSIHSL